MNDLKISDDILVGVEYPALCDVYTDLRIYVRDLEFFNKQYLTTNSELVGLEVYTNNNKLCIIYYILNLNKITIISLNINKKGTDPVWTHNESDLSIDQMKIIINKNKNVFDLNHFYSTM